MRTAFTGVLPTSRSGLRWVPSTLGAAHSTVVTLTSAVLGGPRGGEHLIRIPEPLVTALGRVSRRTVGGGARA